MASDTVPAAIPSPDDPQGGPGTTPTNTGAPRTEPGVLTSLFASVDPARTAFELTPTAGPDTTADGSAETPVDGASSDTYHGGENDPTTSKNAANSRTEKSIVRAWLLAGAERWRKGADARNKRLDIQKARAQAVQVKETRQVTVNNSGGGLFSGGKNSSGAGGKSLGNKGSGGSPKGPNNSSGSTGAGSGSSGGRGGSGTSPAGGAGRGPAGGGTGPGGNSGAGKGSGGRGSSKGPTGNGTGGSFKGPKDSKSNTSGSTGTGSGGGGKGDSRKPSGSDKASGSGKGRDRTQTTTTCGDGSGISLAKDTKPKTDTGKTPGAKGPDGKSHGSKPDGASGSAGPAGSAPGTKDTKDVTKDSTGKPSTPNGGTEGKDSSPNSNTTPKKPAPTESKDKPPTGSDRDQAAGKDNQQAKPQRQLDGKPFSTRESREAGYRDGTRAAKVVAHAQAYRDGVKDGYGDTKQIADRDKQRLDQAHAERKTARQEQDVTAPASSTDHQPQAQPIEVKAVTGTDVFLGAGATRPTMGRGEVRNLVTFITRLETKAATKQQVAEAAKNLHAQALEQAKEVTQLLEGAKQVKGGDKVVGHLTKLNDAANAQAGKAEEIHKRALRAADATRTVLSNARTRYEPIFIAVVNSPETRPAEMKFYEDHGYTAA